MKAYVNRGTKIKWENTPFQPELTDDRIKQVIDANVPPIEVTTPSNGDILSYDSTSEKWVNIEPPAGNLAGLTDVDITTTANGDILSYDGTSEKWVNSEPPAGNLAGLTDVDLVGNIPEGSILRAQSTGHNPDWKTPDWHSNINP